MNSTICGEDFVDHLGKAIELASGENYFKEELKKLDEGNSL